MLNARQVLLFISGVVFASLFVYFVVPQKNSKGGRITHMTITVRMAHTYPEELNKIAEELAGDQLWKGLSLELTDDGDIKSLASYFEGLDEDTPSHSPHGYGICCQILCYDEFGGIMELATNYSFYAKQRRADWQVKLGCEQHILDLFKDPKRRGSISIAIPPTPKEQIANGG